MSKSRHPPTAAVLKTGRAIIERISPEIDCGRYRAKAIAGDEVAVQATIYRDGPEILQAAIRYRGPSAARWSETRMVAVDPGNDLWAGSFPTNEIGRWRYYIEAWTDHFGTWRRGFVKKVEAGQDVGLELEEGALLVEARLKAIPAARRGAAKRAIEAMRAQDQPSAIEAALDEALVELMSAYPDRSAATPSKPVLELTVDRERARFGAWYEFFPRSTGTKTEHGTFQTAKKELARIAEMGFDVVYLPPIHPIGHTYRKGKNNTLAPHPDDIGVPWAIGNEQGGHTTIHPDLGTIDDFDDFVSEAGRRGMEVALDFAIQCSPDHPWVKQHPDWFKHRPDGSIQYAENPPKKYQDIYPIDFDTPDKDNLWSELKAVIDYWIDHGVKIFRVDNPHTKTFPFWEWVISSIQTEHPDVIFLSEAFTRPAVMRGLAKLGFTQSYTYFTWRNTKHELTEYLTELISTEMRHYFRPNFFVNTPDILHEYLQTGGPPAFKIRLVLAAFLSPTYGMYSGYELFENIPVKEGSEEYLNSEKYELRPRDWHGQDNLMPYIAKINDIRRNHPAAAGFLNLDFHNIDKEHLICFSKTSPEAENLLVIVNLNPFHWEEGTTDLDLGLLGIEGSQWFEVHDLITDTTYVWRGAHNYVRLDPLHEPAHVFALRS